MCDMMFMENSKWRRKIPCMDGRGCQHWEKPAWGSRGCSVSCVHERASVDLTERVLSKFWSWDRSRKDYLPFGDMAQLNIYKSAFRYCSSVVDSFQAWDFFCPLLDQMLYTPWRDVLNFRPTTLWESNCIIFGIWFDWAEAMGTKMCFSDRLLATNSLKIQMKCILC